MNSPAQHPSVEEAISTLDDLIRAARNAKALLEGGGPWQTDDESPVHVWGIPATMQLGGRFAILDLHKVASSFPCRT